MKVREKTEFGEKQPSYRYMILPDGKADVFINNFLEEKINEEDGSTSFIYEQTEFRVNSSDITEEMISDNPMSYLDYSNEEFVIDLEERVSAIEDAIEVIAEVIFND